MAAKKGNRRLNRVEFKDRLLNVEESQGQEHDWKAGDILTGSSPRVPIDLSEGFSRFRKAENQELTGSCVGHAVGMVLWEAFVRKGKLPSGSTRYRPSYRWLWEVSKEMDEFDMIPTTMFEDAGTYIKTCLHMARKFGCLLDRDYPMKRRRTIRGSTGKFLNKAAELKILSYLAVKPEGLDLTAYSTYDNWLHQVGSAIVTRVGVDPHFRNPSRSRHGVISEFDASKVQGYHAVVIYGVDADGNYLVLNSWGNRWGYQGRSKMTKEVAAKNCRDSYGIIA